VSLNQLLEEIREITGAETLPRHEAARPGDVRDSLASLERARELLGYAPQVDLRTGLATTVEHLESTRERWA
jgi:nucleoside-diphosphate-sugar epimerase